MKNDFRFSVFRWPFLKRVFALLLLLIAGIGAAFAKQDKGQPRSGGEFMQRAREVFHRDSDSALYYLERARPLVVESADPDVQYAFHLLLGDVYTVRASFEQALLNLQEARRLVEYTGKGKPDDVNTFNRSELELKFGILSFYQHAWDASLNYYESALNILETIKADEVNGVQMLPYRVRIFNNIAGIYIQKREFDKAIDYFLMALEYNQRTSDRNAEASLRNNIGICYLEKKDHLRAAHHFSQALSISEEMGDLRGQAQVINNIGKNHVLQGRFDEAKKYYQRSLQLSRQTGAKESMMNSLKSLSLLSDTIGDYRSAYQYYRNFTELRDSIFSAESVVKIARLEERYKMEQQLRDMELAAERDLAESRKKQLIFTIAAAALLILLLTSVTVIVYQRSRVKTAMLANRQNEIALQQAEIERITLLQDVELKDRELTAKALFMLNKNELIANVMQKLLEVKRGLPVSAQPGVMEIINELRSNQDDNLWTEFEAHFTKVHGDFYHKLHEQFPNLSVNEKKLCAFLKMNLSTKEISAITHQSVNSITVARSRLRKKLRIEGDDVQLTNFLMQFG